VLEEGTRRFKEVTQQDMSLVALSGSERIHVFGEMIQYQATLFAKSRAIGQLGKRGIPAHPINMSTMGGGARRSRSHFDEKNKTGATRVVAAALFHKIPGGFQSIEHDHGASKNLKVYNVACSSFQTSGT
jgi:hypothetical protein